ncbi:Nose resistant to fluoxetine protein 6 [Fasciolopsis buskii]|uniref:Nose resistant to fluoxetine protein 6 n=1 Tax=Fasciolopsis buskii TaxID=27845 RepID=A0A8E0RY77_9TREM|nr:Nose resistant to fluoxetine protein 6 [Fasciolopsis buski]
MITIKAEKFTFQIDTCLPVCTSPLYWTYITHSGWSNVCTRLRPDGLQHMSPNVVFNLPKQFGQNRSNSTKRLAGLLFATALITTGVVTTMVLAYLHQFQVIPADPDWMTAVYVRPYTRWGTYVIGMLLGWILVDFPQITKPRSKLCQYGVSVGGVLLAALLTLLPIYGPYRVSSGELPPLTRLQSAAYHGLSRPSFTLGVAIVVFLCATGYLEPVRAFLAWSAFRAGARLTYCAYLLHPIILTYVYMGAKTPFVVDKTLVVSFYAQCRIWG